MKLRLHSAVTLLLASAAMAIAGSASAQSAGQWTAKVGMNQITPKVDSGDVSAPALPGTKGDVNSSTRPVFIFAYGLTNTSTPACGANALGTTSLVCNGTNVIAGDVSHYMFADDVHPTPFEYALVAKYIAEQMIIKGWL